MKVGEFLYVTGSGIQRFVIKLLFDFIKKSNKLSTDQMNQCVRSPLWHHNGGGWADQDRTVRRRRESNLGFNWSLLSYTREYDTEYVITDRKDLEALNASANWVKAQIATIKMILVFFYYMTHRSDQKSPSVFTSIQRSVRPQALQVLPFYY